MGNDSVLMKRWVRAGNEFDRSREEEWTSNESTLTTDCLRMVETLMWAKKTGECIVDGHSSQKSLFKYLWQVRPTFASVRNGVDRSASLIRLAN